ncbi:hypothetical protein BGZ98_004837, partial [Dissophora globulifera]
PKTLHQVVSLVSQERLSEIKQDPTVVGYHIYSLEPSQLKDIAILSAANLDATRLQQGKDINIYRTVQNKHVVVSKSNNRPTGSVATSGTASTLAGKPMLAAKQPPAISPAPAAVASTPSVTTPPAAGTNSKTKSTAKPSMLGFFGKPTAAAPKPAAATPTLSTTTAPSAQSSKLNFKRKAESISQTKVDDRAEEDSDDAVDSEEERDRRLAMSSRLDQDQGDVVGSGRNDKGSLKKRQRSSRILVTDDDDDDDDDVAEAEDDESVETMSKEARIALNKEKEAQRLALENMMLMDDNHATEVEDEDSKMIDIEEVESDKQTSAGHAGVAATTTTTNGDSVPRRRRGHRAVTKQRTTRNARGYMVTEDYVEMESFSEDEVEPVKMPVAAPAAPAPSAKPLAEPAAGSAGTGPKKKAGGKGNQSLLNFFKKA